MGYKLGASKILTGISRWEGGGKREGLGGGGILYGKRFPLLEKLIT